MIGLFRQRQAGEDAMRLDGARVYLRPPLASDYEAWATLREDSRDFLEPWEPTWPDGALDKGLYRQRLRRYALERRAGSGHGFFILRPEDGALLGGVNLTNIQRGASQSASIGYWIGRPYARQGYMTDALHCVIGCTFDYLRLHRLEAACLPSNMPSRALLRHAGFREEGAARKYLQINGAWRDHLIFALLREDWLARASAASSLQVKV